MYREATVGEFFIWIITIIEFTIAEEMPRANSKTISAGAEKIGQKRFLNKCPSSQGLGKRYSITHSQEVLNSMGHI